MTAKTSLWDDPDYVDYLSAIWRDQHSDETRLRGFVQPFDMPEARILDAGCGTGRMSKVVTRGLYYGIDGSDEMVSRCQRQGLNVLKDNIYDMDTTPNCFYSVVFSNAVLCHVGSVKRALFELWRVTKNRMIVSLYYSWNPIPYGVRPMWGEANGKGWFLPNHTLPVWRVYHLARKLKPRRYSIVFTRNENFPGERLAWMVLDK